MTTLFISDLHLDRQRPHILDLFEHFLKTEAIRAKALYILGDLFEAWVGDDDDSETATRVTDALKQFANSGVPLFVMRGNRDFLFGSGFEARSGCRLLDDPSVIELSGKRVLLVHGDTLCTDDKIYQSWRAQVRSERWQAQFLAASLAQRRQTAAKARAASREHTSSAPETIMDVNQAAVIDAMGKHHVQRMIHGHTHRPAIHRFELNGEPAERIVLGDWYEQGSVLRVRQGNYDLGRLGIT